MKRPDNQAISRRAFLYGSAKVGLALCAGLSVPTVHAAHTVRVAVPPGPHAEVMQVVSQEAGKRGLELILDIREDTRRINSELAQGKLQAASFQNGPAIDRDTHAAVLEKAGRTLTLPFGVYSKKVARLADLKPGASIAIPDDVPGTARALILLHNLGLLVLRDNAGYQAGLKDVAVNRHRYRLVRLPAARLPAALAQHDLAVIGYGEACKAGWHPGKDSIVVEDAFSPFADVLSIRRSDHDQAWVADLLAAYHSEPVKRFIFERYQESVRRPW